jgi:chromosome partitioning protein
MKILTIVSQKGGVGKTTIATALAASAAKQKRQTVLIDLDPQASATFWADIKKRSDFASTPLPAARLPATLKALAEAKCDLVIIDTPPNARDIAFEAIEHADFVLIPTKAWVLDMMAMSRTLELVKSYAKQAAVVLTFAREQRPETRDALKALEELQATICPVRICDRVAYARAQSEGETPQEFAADGAAAKEVRALYQYVSKAIGL